MEIHVPLLPEKIFELGGLPVTNTLLTSWIAALVLILFSVVAARNMRLAPSGLQNVAEAIVELLLGLSEQVAGARARAFLPLVATLFLFILFSNWIGILPGVGTLQINHHAVLRSANSDLSITAAMAVIVFFWVQISGLRTGGLSYIWKFIWPPGIAQLELISEFTRPFSLAVRLYGNIIAGFILVEVMLQIAPPVIPALFLALELGVGLIQALIFAVLTLAFLTLATSQSHSAQEHAASAQAAH